MHDPDVSGWLGLPLRPNEFAPARAASRRGRWMLVGLVVLVGVAVAAAGVVIARPWSAPPPAHAPTPVAAPPAAVPAPAAAPQASPPEPKKPASRRR